MQFDMQIYIAFEFEDGDCKLLKLTFDNVKDFNKEKYNTMIESLVEGTTQTYAKKVTKYASITKEDYERHQGTDDLSISIDAEGNVKIDKGGR